MKKILFAGVVFLSQISMAKIADFNSLIKAQSNTQKEIHSSLAEDIQMLDMSSTAPETEQPEIIVLGTGQLPASEVLSQNNQFQLIKSNVIQTVPNPIAVEQNHFKRLGEELSQAE